ncbi:MAG TPA: hypothetical protein VND93_33645 [Myxococcales bacterium]|nr:hypothetical protein [Myxococcales bacterium]
MRTLASLALVMAAAAGCGSPPGLAAGTLSGTVAVPEGAGGDAYLFLFHPGEGPPARPAVPELATAVSSVRLMDDPHFVFANVPRKPYRLWGFLDRDRSVRLDVDVLAQPSAGDLTSRGLELISLEVPGPVFLDVPAPFDPPAFEIPGAGAFVVLPDQPLLPVRFAVQTTRLSGLLHQVAFAVSLSDRDGDGAPDDADGDGQADLYPHIAFRFLARPGQTVPEGGEALLPVLIENELPLRAALNGDPARVLPLSDLTLDVLPVAVDAAGAALPVIPVGEYQLVVLGASGQVWTLPNGLGASEPSQSVRFFVQHAVFPSGLP